MLQDFLNYLNSKVGRCVYVWGGQGQKGSQISEAWIRRKDTSAANAQRSIDFWNDLKRRVPASEIEAYDCSGLAIYFFYNLKHVLSGDATAHGLMGMCERITSGQLLPGDFVFKVNSAGKATHVGYIVDKSRNIVEAKGRDYGVVKSKFNASWNRCGRPQFLKAAIEGGSSPTPQPIPKPIPQPDSKPSGVAFTRILKQRSPMMRGEDVKDLQALLAQKGFNPGKMDGIFGGKTESAVKQFQKKSGLLVDGDVGKDTSAKLGAVWKG